MKVPRRPLLVVSASSLLRYGLRIVGASDLSGEITYNPRHFTLGGFRATADLRWKIVTVGGLCLGAAKYLRAGRRQMALLNLALFGPTATQRCFMPLA